MSDKATHGGVSGFWASIPQRLRRHGRLLKARTFKTRTRDEMFESAQYTSVNPMKRSLGFWHLLIICIGHMIGAGIFILTGVAAREYAGPSVILAYFIAGAVAFCTAETYSEFASQYPLAGGSFNYVQATLGEGPAFVTLIVLVVDSCLASASLARGWSSYLASVAGVLRPESGKNLYFLLKAGDVDFDLVAFGLTLLVTAFVAFGTRSTAWTNTILKSVNLVIICVVIGITYPHARSANWHPFFKPDILNPKKGLFKAAAKIFFAYKGYNAAVNMAEEAKNPKRDVPLSIRWGMIVTIILYILMAAGITLAQPYSQIDLGAPFSELFKQFGPHWNWAVYVVGIGALIGVFTVILIGKLTTSREFLVLARVNLLPKWLAKVNGWTGTPLRIIILYGGITAILTLFISFSKLTDLTSVGTLFVVIIIAISKVWHRYGWKSHQERDFLHLWAPAILQLGFVLVSVAFTVCFQLEVHWASLAALGGVLIVLNILHFFLIDTLIREPGCFYMPLAHTVCNFSTFGGIFLMAASGAASAWQFAIVFFGSVLIFLVWGCYAGSVHDKEKAAFFDRLRDPEQAASTHKERENSQRILDIISGKDIEETHIFPPVHVVTDTFGRILGRRSPVSPKSPTIFSRLLGRKSPSDTSQHANPAFVPGANQDEHGIDDPKLNLPKV